MMKFSSFNFFSDDTPMLDEDLHGFFKKINRQKILFFFIIFFMIFLSDFASKEWVERNLKKDSNEGIHLERGEELSFLEPENDYFILKSIEVVPKKVSIVYVRNFDIGFSAFRFFRHLFSEKAFFYFVTGLQATVLTTLFFVFVFYSIGFYLPFVFILAGGFSNVFDRFFRGYVVDFVKLSSPEFFNTWGGWPVFNVADVAISIGACWLIFYQIFPKKAELLSFR